MLPYGMIIPFISAALALPMPLPVDEGETLIVSKRTFDCLVRDIEKFAPRAKKKTIRVDISTCPASLTYAFAPEDQPVEQILVLDSARIDCILRNRRHLEAFARTDGKFYRIDLKKCAAPTP